MTSSTGDNGVLFESASGMVVSSERSDLYLTGVYQGENQRINEKDSDKPPFRIETWRGDRPDACRCFNSDGSI